MTVTYSAEALIQAIEQAASPTDLVIAVQALAAARLEAGIPTLIAVLGYNNPAAAAIAVGGLVELGPVAVPGLLAEIDQYNYGARASSIRALAAIADPRALSTLVAAADDFAPSVRRAAAKGLGNLRWFQLPPEQVQPAQAQALEVLAQILRDSDWAIRYAAIVGLQALAASELPDLAAQILGQLDLAQNDPDLTVQARAQMAHQELSPQDSSQDKSL